MSTLQKTKHTKSNWPAFSLVEVLISVLLLSGLVMILFRINILSIDDKQGKGFAAVNDTVESWHMRIKNGEIVPFNGVSEQLLREKKMANASIRLFGEQEAKDLYRYRFEIKSPYLNDEIIFLFSP